MVGPGGPFSDSAVAVNELRAALKTLGFKGITGSSKMFHSRLLTN